MQSEKNSNTLKASQLEREANSQLGTRLTVESESSLERSSVDVNDSANALNSTQFTVVGMKV
jgi:hypothetical protein